MSPAPRIVPRTLSALTAVLAIVLAVGAGAATAAGAGAATGGPDVSAFRGAGSWVDIYSHKALARPEATVAAMDARGVRTLYLETANWRQPRSVEIVRPDLVDRFLEAAHARGMRVVAWYLPGLEDLETDERRILAALVQTSRTGQQFDAFALDIEASLVTPIRARNAALRKLSRFLRSLAGRGYPLGAIVPDNRSTAPSRSLWPSFPYRAVGRSYDVFLPMAYSTHRGRGARYVRRYTLANIRKIRRRSGLGRAARIHVVGGLASGLTRAEARAVVAASRAGGALGASFYNYDITGRAQWSALAPFALAGAPARR